MLIEVYDRLQLNTGLVTLLIKQDESGLFIVEQEAAEGFADIVVQQHAAIASGILEEDTLRVNNLGKDGTHDEIGFSLLIRRHDAIIRFGFRFFGYGSFHRDRSLWANRNGKRSGRRNTINGILQAFADSVIKPFTEC